MQHYLCDHQLQQSDDTMAKDHALGDLVNVDDVEEDFEVEGQVVSLGQAVLSGQAKHHKKVRAHFGRK
jgi:hypothetical protein